MSTFYRFRSVERLLGAGFNELANQTIFFASPEQLNDPMEGYRDFFWSGDLIVWKNFFRHYLRCLQHAFALLFMRGEEPPTISMEELPLFSDASEFPTEGYRELAQEILSLFVGREDVSKYVTGIVNSGGEVRRNELRYHLNYLHLIACECVMKVHEAHGLMQERAAPILDMRQRLLSVENSSFFDQLAKMRAVSDNGIEFVDVLLEVSVRLIDNLTLSNLATGRVDPTARNKIFVFLEFPDKYLKAIERIAFREWYTACFMSECSNSSIWGNYGHNHTGVCLIFEGKDYPDRSVLPVHVYNGWHAGGLIKSLMEIPFKAVDYAAGYAKIDFFRSLGRMPVPYLNRTWYRDENGTLSICAEGMLINDQARRDLYWDNFLGDVLKKTEDWAYEKEYRLVLHGDAVDYADPANRALSYDFASLKGLIFGINTKTDDKLKIIEIIRQKCVTEKRTGFGFFQAFYDSRKRTIGKIEIKNLVPESF